MVGSASLAANSADWSWRKAASAAAPRARGWPQYNTSSCTRAAPGGEQHHLNVGSHAKRTAASPTEEHKPSVTVSCPPVTPVRAQAESSNCPAHKRAAAPAGPPQLTFGHTTVGRYLLHLCFLGAALWHWVQLPEREAYTAGTSCLVDSSLSQEMFLFTAAAKVLSAERTLTAAAHVGQQRTGNTPYANAAENVPADHAAEDSGVTEVADPAQDSPDPPTADTALHSSINTEAESSALEAERPKSVCHRRRGKRRKTTLTSSAFKEAAIAPSAVRLSPLVYKFKLADTSLNAPMRSLPVMVLGDLGQEQNVTVFRDAPHVLVLPRQQSSRRRRTMERSKKGRIQQHARISYRALFLLTLCVVLAATASFVYAKSTEAIAAGGMETSRMNSMVLSLFTGSARARVLLLTVLAGIVGHSLLRQLTVLLVTFCFLGALLGVLVLYGSQAVVNSVTAD